MGTSLEVLWFEACKWLIQRRDAILAHTPHRHSDRNTNTVVALAQAGNWGEAGLAVGAGLASWGQANWYIDMYEHVWLCMTMYDYVYLSMIMYD